MNKLKSEGFTIFEVLVVASIIAIMSAAMFFNFRAHNSNTTARNEVVASVVSNIRRAQTLSINSSTYQGNVVCGYGVHYVGGSNNYLLYARQKPSDGSCTSAGNHNYTQGNSGYT